MLLGHIKLKGIFTIFNQYSQNYEEAHHTNYSYFVPPGFLCPAEGIELFK